MVERRNIGGTQAFCRCHDDSVGASQRQIRILRDEFGRSGEVVSGGGHNSSVRAKREVPFTRATKGPCQGRSLTEALRQVAVRVLGEVR